MDMDLADFNDVIRELNIMDSAERFERNRIDNHAKAVG
jgi:hypothetical protein